MPRSMFTAEVRGKLLEAFRVGQPSVAAACAYAGISDRTFQNWMAKAAGGDAEYQEFADDVEKAKAEASMVNLAVIRRAAQQGNWQAAGWALRHTVTPVGGHLAAVEKTLDALGVSDVASGEIQLARGLAAQLDNNPFSPSELWREYRQALKQLREALGGDGPSETELEKLAARMGGTDVHNGADSG